MDLSQFIIMKHELLLTIIALVLLVAEIALDNKKKVIPLAISLFGFYTVFRSAPWRCIPHLWLLTSAES